MASAVQDVRDESPQSGADGGAADPHIDVASPRNAQHKFTVRMSHVSLHQQAAAAEIRTVWSSFVDDLAAPFRAASRLLGRAQETRAATTKLLDDVTVEFESGSSTIVLAPPDAEASTLLRMLAGRVAPEDVATVTIDGATLPAIRAGKDMELSRAVQLVEETDSHEALLTVRETLTFARQLRVKESAEACAASVNAVMDVCGIAECADTYLGNSIFRGVSGGQKRRVTLAEALLLPHRILLLDAPTGGLDAVYAQKICQHITTAARKSGGLVIASIQGAGTEIFELFDNALLLAEGRIAYAGPVSGVDAYLASVGMPRPVFTHTPEWVLQALTLPAEAVTTSASAASQGAVTQVNNTAPVTACTSVKALTDAWTARCAGAMPKLGPVAATAQVQLSNPGKDIPSATDIAPARNRDDAGDVANPFAAPMEALRADAALPAWLSVWWLTKRQLLLQRRNWLFIALRLLNCIVMAAILGTVFIEAPKDGFSTKYALALFAVTFISFINNAEIPLAVSSRFVVYKHASAAVFSEWAYAVSVMIAHIPLTALSDLLFCAILYYLGGYQGASDRFFFFFFLVLCHDFANSVIYRSVCYAAPTPEVAQAFGSMFTAAALCTGGYFVLRSAIPRWMVWLLYISPHFWSVTAIANNEYGGGAYAVPYSSAAPAGPSKGTVYLQAFDYAEGALWQWGAIIFLLGIYLVTGCAVQPLLLRFLRRDKSSSDHAVQRPKVVPADDGTADTRAAAATAAVAASTRAHASSLMQLFNNATASATHGTVSKAPSVRGVGITVSPCVLSFYDVCYYVKTKAGVEKQLLRNVSGYAKPGTLTALMGASGAGKTTLMDLLAQRKTIGRCTGAICIDGAPITAQHVKLVSGYVEQESIHSPHVTGREAIEFSCRVRRRKGAAITTSEAEHERMLVDGVIDRLRLHDFVDTLVGSMSMGELKVLSIAVEMVAQPSILFLDEPTSGAGAADTPGGIQAGCTVLCTIHQPSPIVFFAFEQLLLLTPGGYQAYFGSMGLLAKAMQEHLESAPGVPTLPADTNPAVWMLEATIPAAVARADPASDGVESGDETGKRLAVHFASSPSGVQLEDALKTMHKSLAGDVVGRVDSQHAGGARNAGMLAVFVALLHRAWLEYSRNVSYNRTRIIILTLLAVLFGCEYYKIDQRSFTGIQSAFGSMLAGHGFVGVVLFTVTMPHMDALRVVLYRESAADMYPRGLALFAYILVELVYVLLISQIFSPILYFMLGFRADAAIYFMYTLVGFLVAFTYQLAGMMMVGIFPNIVVSQVVGGMTLAVYFLFGGVFIPPGDITRYWRWMYYVAFESWAVRAVTVDQYYCAPGDTGGVCSAISVVTPDAIVSTTPYAYLSSQLQFGYDDRWRAVGALAGFVGVYALATVGIYHFVSHLKR